MQTLLTDSGIEQILDRVSRARIAVVGDVMLDRYYRGKASRLSPEAPVPVVEIEEEAEHPGGAANVAYNLSSLGVQTSVFGVIGGDRSGEQLSFLLDDLGIACRGLVVESDRATTVKTRVIAEGQHIVRADRESRGAIREDVQQKLMAKLQEQIGDLDGIILQDYNKGVFSPKLIHDIIYLAGESGVPTYVDPKFENFFAFQGATLFKPNRKETEDALQRRLESLEDKLSAAQELRERLQSRYVVLTMSGEGMILIGDGEEPERIPTRSIQVADVSGAGDTVIATLAAASAAGSPMREAVELANIAAGIVCEQVGTVPITRSALQHSLHNMHA
ncbi:MAG: D-glycero-beta-D-manno-heptose-7-phosphate kinase [Candidatus Kapaibacterium sp.]